MIPCVSFQEASVIFNGMEDSGTPRDVITYNAMIGLCEDHGELRKAECLIQEGVTRDVFPPCTLQPRKSSCNSIIPIIDLHFLPVPTARAAVRHALANYFVSELSREPPLRIIVGNGRRAVRNGIVEMLSRADYKKFNVKISKANPGLLIVARSCSMSHETTENEVSPAAPLLENFKPWV
jgi:hypothetical protein